MSATLSIATSAAGETKKHIRRLDGLRAVAVLMVLLLHHQLFDVGWMGVDLFFVLSGYLITGILRKDKNQPRFWKRFYLKRATRILPPFLLLIAVVAVVQHPVSPLSILGYTLSLGNLVDLTRLKIATLDPLWSLAVEEHFYLLWPIAIFFLNRRQLITVLAALVAIEPILRAVVTPHTATMNVIYGLTPFRLDGLALGSLLALLLESSSAEERLKRLTLPGLTLCAGLYVGLTLLFRHSNFRLHANSVLFNSVGYSLVALMCFFFFIFILLRPVTHLSRVLELKPVVFLGGISYSIYLYSQFIRDVVSNVSGVSNLHTLALIDIPITLAIAALSFYFYERPIIRVGRNRARSIDAAPQSSHEVFSTR